MKRILLLLTFLLVGMSGFAQADLVITVTDNQQVYVPGTEAVYTIKVTNFGPNRSNGVVVSSPMPAGISSDYYWEGTNNSFGTGALYNKIPKLEDGESVTYTLTISVPLTYSGDLVVTATADSQGMPAIGTTPATPPVSDPNTASNSATDRDIIGNADIVVTNTDFTNVYNNGANSVYTVTVTNNGPTDAINVIVRNDLPSGITAADFSWTGSNGSSGTNQVLNNTIPVMHIGETVSYTVTISVPTTFGGLLINKTNVYTTTTDPNTTDNTATDTDVHNFGADIIVTNTDNQSFYVAGQPRPYTLKVLNNGPNTATNVTVSNPVPVGAGVMTWSGSNSSSGTGALSDVIASLAPGAFVTYNIVVNLPASFTGNLVSQASVSSDQPDPNPSCPDCTDTDTAGADLVVTNTNNQTQYTGGETPTYIVTVTNNGPSAAENVSVGNNFSSGVTVLSWTGSNGTNGGGAFGDMIANLPSGATVTYTIQVQIPKVISGNLTSQASAVADTPDPVPACTQCLDTDTQRVADISVTNTDGQTTYAVGSPNTRVYTVVVTNNGPNAAVNVSVNLYIPSSVAVVSWVGNNGTNGNGALGTFIPNLASGASVTYTVTLQIPTTFTGNFTATAAATATGNADNASANNQVVDTDTPLATADLVIVNTDNQDIYTPGTTIPYTLTITNNGPQAATGINVSYPMPAGITVMNWSGNSTSGSGSINNVIATLANGATVTYNILLDVPATFVGNLTTQANVTATTTDPVAACPRCTDTDVLAGPTADVSITVSNNQTTYAPGTVTVYTVLVTNNGPQSASNIQVSNPVPAGITTMTWSGNATSGTGALSNTIATLASGASVSYTVSVTIPGAFTGNLDDQASFTTTSVDPNAANNTFTDTDTPKQADIVVTNTSNQANPPKGSATTFTVTVTNNGPQDATNVTVTNPIPAGTTSMSWTSSIGTSGTGALNTVLPLLATGATITYTITVQIPGNFSGTLSSTASATSVVPDPNAANSTATATTTPSALPAGTDVAVSLTDTFDYYIAGQNRVYTLTVTNNGPQTATNINVSTILPSLIATGNYSWTGNSTSGTGAISNTIASLSSGASVVYTITITIPSGADQNANLVNTASAAVGSNDPNNANNSATDIDTPRPFADLFVKKTDNKTTFSQTRNTDDKDDDTNPPVLVNEYNVYTITIINYGPSDAVDVNVSDPLPVNPIGSNAPVLPSDMVWSGSNGSSGTGSLNNVVANIPVGSTVTYTVTVHVPKNYNINTPYSNFTNTVNISAQTTDPVISNNTSTDVDIPGGNFLFISNDPLVYSPNGLESGLAKGYVENVLVRSHCANVSNFQMNSGPTGPPISNPVSFGVGYFNRKNSDFPITDGIVLTSGNVLLTSGPNDPGVNSNSNNWTGDNDLSSSALQPPVGATNAELYNPVYLKFDFVPSAPELSFNFIFAADEYSVVSSYECTYSDVFAFILTDLTAGGPAKNLAVLPGVLPPTPVKVTAIHRLVSGCAAINPQFFGKHNFDTGTPENVAVRNRAAIDVNGQTKLLQAKGTVIPGHTYSIKLVIANKSDGALNSSVFIEGGSFKFDSKITGDGPYATEDNFGPGHQVCHDEVRRIQMGTSALAGATYSWKKNGVTIPGETNFYYDATESAIYTATITFGSGCKISDDIEVLFFSAMPTKDPHDVPICDDTAPYNFNIDQTADILNGYAPADYDILYYENLQDAKDWAVNDIATTGSLTNYVVNNTADLPKTVYVRIMDNAGSCVSIKPIVLRATSSAGTISYPTGTYCINGPVIPVTNSSNLTPGGQYIASPSGLNIDPITGAVNLTGSSAGTYSIVYTIPAGVCPQFDTPAVPFVVSACVATTIDGRPAVCASSSFNLTTSNAGASSTYAWYDNDGNLIGTTAIPQITVPSAPAVGGNYNYSVVATIGTESSAASATVVVVNPTPEAKITGPSSICTGSSTTVTFTGTPGAFVTYSDGVTSPDPTIQLSNPGGSYSLPTGTLNAAKTYQILSVSGDYTPPCQQMIPALAPDSYVTINVGQPDATITSTANTEICAGTGTSFVITGTPDATVSYNKTENSVTTAQTPVVLPTSGTLTVQTGTLSNAGVVTYTLTNISSPGATGCSKALSGAAVTTAVQVNALPTASVIAGPTVCQGTSGSLTFSGTPNATVNYTDGTTTYSTTLSGSGSSIVTTGALGACTTFTITSVVSATTVPCTTNYTTARPSASICVDFKPVITADPMGTTVCNGQSVTFSVTATGSGLHYQWNGPSGAVGTDQASYTITSPTNADAGNYTVTVSGTCTPAVTSAIATLSVNQPTVITTQPAGVPVCEQQAISLSVSATGVTLSYQWYGPLGLIPGATSATLTIPSAALSDAGAYYCAVINPCQTVNSNTTTVVVNQLAAITSSPTGTTICTGENFTLSASAVGTGLSYQWQNGSVPVNTTLNPSAATATLTVTGATLADAGNYSVVVTGTCNTVTSAIATMVINQAPAITDDPDNTTVCSGNGVVLTGIATGSNLTYRWTFNGATQTETTPTFTIPAATAANAGSYILYVKNASCAEIASATAVVTVNELPLITQDPQALTTVCEGTAVSLSVTATGTNLTYQWYKGGVIMPSETNATLNLAGVLTDAAIYTVTVSGACAPAVTSQNAQVIINQAPAITDDPDNTTVCSGNGVVLTGIATGSNLTYRWTFNGATQTETTPTFTIPAATAANAGSYILYVKNASCAEIASATAVVTVNELPLITQDPQALTTVCEGTAVSLSVTATGTNLTYQWYKGGVIMPSETNATLNLAGVLTDAAIYTVTVSGACTPAVTSQNAQVIIDDAPMITADPVALTTKCEGETITLSVTASGTNLGYQWFFGTSPIAGATLSTYTITNATLADSGSYTAQISNTNGTCPPVTSAAAVVQINNAPGITTHPASNIYCLNDKIVLTITATGNNVSYQWQFNNVDIAGETTNILTIASAQLSNSGNYTCIVSSPPCPSITSNVAQIVVKPLPVAGIDNNVAPICQDHASEVRFTGTPYAIITYTVNGSAPREITLSAIGEAILPTGLLTQTTTYDLVSVRTNDSPSCSAPAIGSAVVTVNQRPDITLPQDGYICIDVNGNVLSTYTLETGLSPADYSFQWSLDGVAIASATQPDYVASAVGTYSVLITTTNGTSCTLTVQAPIISSVPPVDITAQVTSNYFDDNATVVVTVSPTGDYEYRIDDGPYQESNIFSGVSGSSQTYNSLGVHTIYARDKKACGEISYSVTLIDYPKYFTPNGDGYHDTWNISTLSNQPNAKIYIFDRFGKLLKQISTTGTGWDGTFNGQAMLADDYWFVVKYSEQGINKEFKAHFAIKR